MRGYKRFYGSYELVPPEVLPVDQLLRLEATPPSLRPICGLGESQPETDGPREDGRRGQQKDLLSAVQRTIRRDGGPWRRSRGLPVRWAGPPGQESM
ncbi:hypothetical protein BV898_17183 [Hypsibius exemplaris]|uniref:Uncharacterized protein n=1 Tax=Hypsibius exemplaris TaxID=2072580 RepID=A0A9X6NGT1_HYPEX|nr:hypothetical protein BV898_17183 [Hypsibius exemplaris]